MHEVTLVRCYGCGVVIGQEPPTTAMIEHIRTCPRHPLASEIRRYKEREEHFAKVLQVADGGQYRADWDGAISNTLERYKALEIALSEAADGLMSAHRMMSAICETESTFDRTKARDQINKAHLAARAALAANSAKRGNT